MLVLLIGGVEMLDTLNVARYIINYSNQEKYGISNLLAGRAWQLRS